MSNQHLIKVNNELESLKFSQENQYIISINESELIIAVSKKRTNFALVKIKSQKKNIKLYYFYEIKD